MKNLKNILLTILGAGILLTLLGVAYGYYAYRYNDCLAVGHAETYCFLDLFTN